MDFTCDGTGLRRGLGHPPQNLQFVAVFNIPCTPRVKPVRPNDGSLLVCGTILEHCYSRAGNLAFFSDLARSQGREHVAIIVESVDLP